MSRYFARLVQRTLGAERTSLAAPSTSPARTSAEAGDPFEATAPMETAPPAQPTGRVLPERIEPARPAVQLPAEAAAPQVRTPSVEAALYGSEPEAQEAPRIIAPAPVAPPVTPAPLQARETQPREIVEHTRVEHELRKEIVPAVHPAMPLPPRSTAATPERESSAAENPPPVPVPLIRNLQEVVRAMEPRNELRALQPLDPMRSGPITEPQTAAAQREEPRLVIGRMQIEVVPAAPPATPVAPRATRRSRTGAVPTTAISQVQFGLGQM
jgi:hypothetical protein